MNPAWNTTVPLGTSVRYGLMQMRIEELVDGLDA
jgi:hypothetical protein